MVLLSMATSLLQDVLTMLRLVHWFLAGVKVKLRLKLQVTLTFADGGKLNVPHSFTWSVRSNQTGGGQASPSLKVGLVRFARGGATVTFTASAKCDDCS